MNKPCFLLIAFVCFFLLIGNLPSESQSFGTNKQAALTSHAQLKTKMLQLAESSDIMKIEEIGSSVFGREIYLAKFSTDFPIPKQDRKKPLIFVFAQQHGNEPSGKEAAIVLSEEFARGKHTDLLRSMDILLIPQVNPDGSENGERRNANNADLNRDHILLAQPETRAMHHVFHQYYPEVTLDVHEYNDYYQSRTRSGYVRPYDEMLGALTNPNITVNLRHFAVHTTMKEIEEFVTASGFTFHRYLVGGPAEARRYRYSTTNINDGRNSLGIYHSLSFILEGQRYGDLATKLDHRIAAQKSAIIGLMKSVAKHEDKILELVSAERKKLRQSTKSYPYIAPCSNYLKIKNVSLPLKVKLMPSETVKDTVFHNFTPFVRVPFYLHRPKGYLVPRKLQNWIDILEKHHIQIDSNFSGMTCLAEEQEIDQIGRFAMEGHEYLDVKSQINAKKISPDSKEYVFVPSDQLGSHFISLTMEPQSVMCLMQYQGFADTLAPGQEYPILRVLKWGESNE